MQTVLYAAAYKIPTIVVLVSTIFMDAWQVSAVSEIKDRKALAKFFSNVFRGYQSIIFFGRQFADSFFENMYHHFSCR